MKNLALNALFSAAAFCLGLAAPNAVVAQNFDLDAIIQAELLPGWRMDNGRQMAAVQVTMAPGWHTYWRQPGDTGIPPRFDWSGSRNVGAARVLWPAPEVIELGDSTSLGYHNQVVWPVEVTPTGSGKMHLRGFLQMGVCAEVCLPVDFDLNAELTADGVKTASIMASLAAQPTAGRGMLECAVAPISDGLRITMRLPSARAKDVGRAVIETGDPLIWVSRPALRHEAGYWMGEADLVPPDGKPFALERGAVRLTVFGSNGVRDYLGCAGY